jgi:hypothetical protein
VGDLLSRIEITKLARELDRDEEGLAFLRDRSPAELRDLRNAISAARFERHEDRVTRLAGRSRLLPTPLMAKIARLALGPMLCGRVACVLNPRDAAKLATHFDAAFLADLSVALDPARVRPLISALPADLLVSSGRQLLAKGEHLTLARMVAVVDLEVALTVVDEGTPEDLLQVALFTEEQAVLDSIVAELPDETLAGVVQAAAEADAYDAAVTVLAALSPASCARLVSQVHVVEGEQVAALVAAVAEHDMWPHVLPSLHLLEQDVVRRLVNVPATLDPAVVGTVVDHARSLDLGQPLGDLLRALDDEHVAVLSQVKVLHDPDVQAWLTESSGASSPLVASVLDGLGTR